MAQLEKYLQKGPEPQMMKRVGIAFSVLESGTGIGAFFDYPIGGFFHLGATSNFYLLRDSKQIDYSYDGYPLSINKKNNVYLVDLLMALKLRLFPYDLDDNFQPYLSVSGGPVYGMNYPENEELPDQFGWALSGIGAAGVNVIMDKVYIFGIRMQYRYMRFEEKIGEKQNHSTFDLRIELGKQF
jgi:hypothetical protein